MFLAKRTLKTVVLLFAAALLADIINFGLEPLRAPDTLERPIVVQTNPLPEFSPTGLARRGSHLWQQPWQKRTITISVSPFSVSLDLELAATRTHPIVSALAELLPEDAVTLLENAFGKAWVNGLQLRSEDFQSPIWTIGPQDGMIHVRISGLVHSDQEDANVIIVSVPSLPVCDEFNLSFSGMRLNSLFPVPDELSESHARVSGESLKNYVGLLQFHVGSVQHEPSVKRDPTQESRKKSFWQFRMKNYSKKSFNGRL